jgi:hypothetical protein
MDQYLSINNDINNDNNINNTNNTNNTKIIYNKEQLDFINSPLENSKLLGIPGGGKTQSIIGKVLHHNFLKEITLNNQFLILTFSRRACRDFIEKGKRQNKKLFTTKNIRTLHSIAGKIVYKVLDKKSSSQDTVIISAIQLMDKYIDIIQQMEDFISLKVIFVDEAQDISEIQYDLIMKISELTNASVIMIGDPNQNIYQFQKGSDQFLLNHSGKTYTLIQNYRSTQNIVNLINQFRPWNSLTAKMISASSGIYNNKKYDNLPKLYIGRIENIIQDIIKKIVESPFPRDEIAIIGPVKKSKPVQDSYANIGLSLFTNLLNSYGIKYVKHYEDTNSEEECFSDVKKITDHVNLLTVHGSKGLEFNQVFLLNFHTATFGIIPNEEKYKEFKYLWYVGLSRASFDLNIYIDRKKLPWYELKTCPPSLYKLENLPPSFPAELKFQDEIVPIYHTITEILGSKKYLDDKLLFELENIFGYEIEEFIIFNDNERNNEKNNENKENSENIKNKSSIANYKNFAALFGIFIEQIFNFYYHLKFKIIPDFVTKLKKIINNTIIIPKQYIYDFKILRQRCPFIKKDLVKLSDFAIIKNIFKKGEQDIFEYLCEILENDYNKEFFLDCENDVIKYSKKDLLECIQILEEEILENKKDTEENIENKNKNIIIKSIFDIALYYYQRNNETAYLWEYDFTEELKDLEFYINNVIKYSEKIEEKFTFHPIYRHSKLPLVGEFDLISNNEKEIDNNNNNPIKIIDIKFSNNLNLKHILQLILYNHLYDPSLKKNIQLELWNFHLGKKYIIQINRQNLDILKLLKILSKGINKKLQNMIFFYDLETTGLTYTGKKVDIIERYFQEMTTGIIPSAGLLKPIDVPFIPFEISNLTGITKEMVDQNGDHIQKFRNEMDIITSLCHKPIFIAHNGNSFDHKLLISKNILDEYKCRFLDSKMIIRLFLNHTITAKSLSAIFNHLFNFIPNAHRAEADVKMLIAIFKKLEIDEEKILKMI